MSSQRSSGQPSTTLPITDAGKSIGVRAVRLPGAGIDVADGVAAGGVDCRDHGAPRREGVHVKDLRIDRRVDAAAQLVLPGVGRRGDPGGLRGPRPTDAEHGDQQPQGDRGQQDPAVMALHAVRVPRQQGRDKPDLWAVRPGSNAVR